MQLPGPPLALVKTSDGRYGLLPSPDVQSLGLGGGGAAVSSAELGRAPSAGALVSLGALQGPSTPRSHSSSSPDLLALQGRYRFSPVAFSPPPRLARLGEKPTSERLRGKLIDLGTSFTGLDRQVEDDKRRRREIEQRRIQEILVALQKLGKMLDTEIERREEATQSMQQAIETCLDDMVGHLQGRILERFGQLSQSVESLCERCSTVERGIQQLRGEVPSKPQVETARLQLKIRELTAELQEDRRRRFEQDAQLQRAVEEVEYGIDMKVQRELAQLERQIEALQELIDEVACTGDSAETLSREASVFKALAALRTGIEEEAHSRERADDQVVQAINEYTSMLHRSLRAANA